MARKITRRNNYFNLAMIIIGVVIVTLASSNLYKNYSANKINHSYISKYVANIQSNEIQSVSVEFSSDTFIYVGYTGTSDVYHFEVKLKRTLKENELFDNFLYLDATKMMTDKEYITNINKSFGLNNENGLKKLPGIIYYSDNKVTDVIDSSTGLINTGDVVQLLEKYEIIK